MVKNGFHRFNFHNNTEVVLHIVLYSNTSDNSLVYSYGGRNNSSIPRLRARVGTHQQRGLTVGKKKKERNAAVSGMPRGTANARLRKRVLFELLRSAGTNICHHCGKHISISEDLALEHIEDWKDDEELFWKLPNIAFSHLDCSSGAARQEDKHMLVDVTIENEHGEELPTFHHKGGIHVAGRKGDRYNLRIANRTVERLEIVATVDGRDVISGKKGDVTNTGYVIRPFDDILIKGFRQNNGQVAAFRFSKKGASYSTKKKTPENVGVVGVAIFMEKVDRPQWVYDSDTTTTQNIYCGDSKVNANFTTNTHQSSNSINSGVVYHESATAASAGVASRLSKNTGKTSSILRGTKTAKTQDLGTKYGESITDHCSTTSFYRLNRDPEEVWQIWYDTMSALRKKGIPTHRTRKQSSRPDPFPKSNITPGFAKPPPR